MSETEVFSFDKEIIRSLPALRRFALKLTRSSHAADDLVQTTILKALAAKETFTPGTSFGAWTNTILRNQFYEGYRKNRETTDIEDLPADYLTTPARQFDALMSREVVIAISLLPLRFRQAIEGMVTHEGESAYEIMSKETGDAIGTIKSRVSRAREALTALLNGERPDLIMKALADWEDKNTEAEQLAPTTPTAQLPPPFIVSALER